MVRYGWGDGEEEGGERGEGGSDAMMEPAGVKSILRAAVDAKVKRVLDC